MDNSPCSAYPDCVTERRSRNGRDLTAPSATRRTRPPRSVTNRRLASSCGDVTYVGRSKSPTLTSRGAAAGLPLVRLAHVHELDGALPVQLRDPLGRDVHVAGVEDVIGRHGARESTAGAANPRPALALRALASHPLPRTPPSRAGSTSNRSKERTEWVAQGGQSLPRRAALECRAGNGT